MTVQEPGLHRTERRFDTNGWRYLLAGGVLALLGFLVYLLGTGTANWVEGLGAMIMSIAAVPTIAGVALLIIAAVSGWGARKKPFA